MDETKYQDAMTIILHAGNAKAYAMGAIDDAEAGNFKAAEAALENARSEMGAAHATQFGMVQHEAAGEPVDVNIILVHAQDHLTMAIQSIDFAERFIKLYRLITTR